MPSVRITTLGGLAITLDGQPIEWLSSQRMRVACLVYIAVERDVSRDRLLGLFWPEAGGDRARASLNQCIYTIRQSLGESVVDTAGDRVRISAEVDVDVSAFTAAAANQHLAHALEYYQGRFLHDAALPGSAEFEQWIDSKRVLLDRLHRRVRRNELDRLLAMGDRAEALAVAQRWCDLDPDEDEAHHRYIAVLIDSGQRTQAIRHFEQYCERLRASELEPLDETAALIASLRNREPVTILTRSAPTPADSALRNAHDSAPLQPTEPARLLAELKRRGVFKAVGMYLLLAWGAIEVSDTVFPNLGLPEWAPSLVTVLALIGLPFCVFFAWQYDITRTGVNRTSHASTGTGAVPRVVPRWVTASIVLVVLLYGGFEVYRRVTPPASLGTVAVFPFCIAGEGLKDEADDVALLIARGIDAIPELQSADPNILIPNAEAAKLHCRDARGSIEVARRLGAKGFILGSLTHTGEEVRAAATLYDLAGAIKWSVDTSAPWSDWGQVVDSLVRKIVEHQGITTNDRMLSVAATTTESKEARKAFLDGERHLRALEWAGAIEDYRKAAQLDTTFALAWFRLAESLGLAGEPMAERLIALQRAQQVATVLPEREQRLLYAFDPSLKGMFKEAADRLRSYLGTYPDDPQAWFWLGEVEYFGGGHLGHDPAEIVRAYRKGAELGSRDALFGLAWSYHDAGDYVRSDSVTRLVMEVGAGGDWVVGLEAAQAFRSGDKERIERMITRIDGLPAPQRTSAPPWGYWAGNYAVAERLAERAFAEKRSESAHTKAMSQLVNIRLMRGKRAAAAKLLERLALSDPTGAVAHRVSMVLDPAVRAPAKELRDLRRQLDSLVENEPPGTPEHARHQPDRLYWLGRIAVLLGDLTAAERYADRVQALPPFNDSPPGNANLAAGIRAHIAIAQADTAGALVWLDRMVFVLPFWVDMPASYRATDERVLRADILARRGRLAEAANWYSWLEVTDAYVLKRRGELAEQLGNRARAIEMYRRLGDLLAECDPELLPTRQFALERLAALR